MYRRSLSSKPRSIRRSPEAFARTPPSTFLFLQIQLSKNTKPEATPQISSALQTPNTSSAPKPSSQVHDPEAESTKPTPPSRSRSLQSSSERSRRSFEPCFAAAVVVGEAGYRPVRFARQQGRTEKCPGWPRPTQALGITRISTGRRPKRRLGFSGITSVRGNSSAASVTATCRFVSHVPIRTAESALRPRGAAASDRDRGRKGACSRAGPAGAGAHVPSPPPSRIDACGRVLGPPFSARPDRPRAGQIGTGTAGRPASAPPCRGPARLGRDRVASCSGQIGAGGVPSDRDGARSPREGLSRRASRSRTCRSGRRARSRRWSGSILRASSCPNRSCRPPD